MSDEERDQRMHEFIAQVNEAPRRTYQAPFDPTTQKYCPFCGNQWVGLDEAYCSQCAVYLEGELADAYRIFQQIDDQDRICCFGLITDPTPHLYVHGKYWESSNNYVSVESGLRLYADAAVAYNIYDYGSWTDGEEYGPIVSYEDPEFWSKTDQLLSEGCEYTGDIHNCKTCGYHTLEPHDSCADDFDIEEEEVHAEV